eukprot:TRINITY_DN4277_c0_g1_i2.p1 TRINITY_DN4277_c0_g1~~TRINITY_DN4277_c0_g1_i2.p1  ORF type:complete len:189 (+),score=8.21 TRINITY_DN4277_c0_g1_i2:60-569(+)
MSISLKYLLAIVMLAAAFAYRKKYMSSVHQRDVDEKVEKEGGLVQVTNAKTSISSKNATDSADSFNYTGANLWELTYLLCKHGGVCCDGLATCLHSYKPENQSSNSTNLTNSTDSSKDEASHSPSPTTSAPTAPVTNSSKDDSSHSSSPVIFKPIAIVWVCACLFWIVL